MQRAIGQADPTLEAHPGLYGFQDDQLGEMAGQSDTAADRKLRFGHLGAHKKPKCCCSRS